MRVSRNTVFGLTASGVLAAGLLFAPVAMADNYAPTLPPATNGAVSNPAKPTPVGAPASGVTLVSSATADKVTPSSFAAPPSTSAGGAPSLPVKTGKVIVAEVGSLPANTKIAVTMIIGGQKVDLGSAKTDKNGNLTLPGIRGAKPGVITVQITAPDGTKSYVKITVKARR